MNKKGVSALVFSCSSLVAASALGGGQLQRLTKEDLQVTEGTLESRDGGHLFVGAAKMRAIAHKKAPSIAELRFTDLGPTKEIAPLASGDVRRQIGIKLRGEDTCNVLYVMWRLEPKSSVVVSLKKNAGKHTHTECGAGGYRNLKPSSSRPVPVIHEGETHVLRAELKGRSLTVEVDRTPVWQGELDREAAAIEGPVGLRSDNGRFELELYTD